MTRFDDTRRAPDDEVAVSIRGLYKIFGDTADEALAMARDGGSKEQIQEATGAVVALADVSFDIRRGEIFVVMGLSGCGKSTLVRCINRLIEATAGEVWIGGREVTAMDDVALRELRRREVAMVFQHFGLLPHRNVIENVAWPLEVADVDRRERLRRAAESLELVGLGDWHTSMPQQLSGGMKQRVGLARGLALNTPVLLMDEPFSALDPVIRRDLQDELLQLQESVHKTIVFITHDLNEAVRVGDRIAIMRDGLVVQEGTPNEVVLSPANAFVREFTRDVRLHAMVNAGSIMDEPALALPDSMMASIAAAAMESQQQTHCCVVDDQRRYVGTAYLSNVLTRIRTGDCALAAAPLITDGRVLQDTVLDDLVPAGLRSQHPLVVLDANGVLVGEIPLDRLAAAMVSDDAAAAAAGEGAEG